MSVDGIRSHPRWCRSASSTFSSQVEMWGLYSSHVDSHRSMKAEFQAGHCVSLSCTVVRCVVPHSAHGAVSLLHGCPHPSHLTFPHSHCSQYDRRLPLSGSQEVQWVPGKTGLIRLLRIHFFAGVGHSHPHNNTVSRNKKFWVDQVTPPPPREGQGVGKDKGGGG